MKSPDDTLNKTPESEEDLTPAFHSSKVSIDRMLISCLEEVQVILDSIAKQARSKEGPSRETVQNLKDCTMLLLELKKKEQEFLDSLTDVELEELSKNHKRSE